MRIAIKLLPETPVQLPFSYYPKMASAVYQAITESDANFAKDLHEGDKHKNRIKLFSFSPLHSKMTEVHMPDKSNNKNGALVFKGLTGFFISSPWPELMNRIGEGLLKNGCLRIGSQLLRVVNAQILAPPKFDEKMSWSTTKTASIVTSWSRKTDNKKMYAFPDKPADGQACDLLLKTNLIHKWQRLCEIRNDIASAWSGLSESQTRDAYSSDNVKINLQPDSYKKKLHYIKGAPVRSWQSEVEIVAPSTLQRLIWSCGLGEMNSMGFGMVREVEVKG